MRRRLVPLLAVCLALAGAAPAAAAPTAEVCVFRAAVHDTPRGIVIGYLHDGARVKLLGHTAAKRWYRVRNGPLRLAGWMKARSICR